MRKAAVFLLAATLLAVLTACIPVKTVSVTKIPPDAQVSPAEDSRTISVFLRDMLDYKTTLWKKIEQKYAGTDLAPEFNSINAPDYSITILPMYDTLALTGSGTNRREGQLMLSGIPAYEELNGSVLTFGYDYTYDEDTGNYKKGSVETARGELDFDKDALFYEDIVKMNGVVNARTVIEIVRLADKSFVSQYLFGSENQGKVTAVFSAISKNSFEALCGGKQEGADFSYQSIRGGPTALEKMAEGFTIRLGSAADENRAEIVKK